MVPATDQASTLGGEAQRRCSEAVPKATSTFLAPWHRASERESRQTTHSLPASTQGQYFGLTLAHVLPLAVVPEEKKPGDKIEPETSWRKVLPLKTSGRATPRIGITCQHQIKRNSDRCSECSVLEVSEPRAPRQRNSCHAVSHPPEVIDTPDLCLPPGLLVAVEWARAGGMVHHFCVC